MGEVLAFAWRLGASTTQKVMLFLTAIVFLVFLLGVVAAFFAIGGAKAFMLLFLLSIVLFALIVFIIAILATSRQALRLQEFAARNGLSFTFKKPPPTDGAIFSIGDSHEYLTVVSGTYQKMPFEFGNYHYSQGSGRNRQRYSWGVIEVKLTRKLPHILLDSRRNNPLGFSNLPGIASSQELTLEGNFNDYFTLYVPRGYERDALYFITPELMALFIDHGAGYDIEIIDDRLLIYNDRPFQLQTQSAVEHIFKLISLLGAETQENTTRYADARVGNRDANVVAQEGQRLKEVSPVLGIIFVVVLFAVVIGIVAVAAKN